MAKKSYIQLAIITLLGLILRYIAINQSLWLDEAVQAVLSSKSLSEILYFRQGDFHPPLFYILTHFWQQYQHAEIWLRSLPILFGTLSIPAIYVLSREWIDQHRINIFSKEIEINIISAFLLAISPFHVYYSQEYRSYSLLCFLTILSGIQLKKIIQKNNIINICLLGLLNALILYTHYSGIFFIITEVIYTLMYSRKNIKVVFVSVIISFTLFIPWLPRFIEQLSSGVNIDSYLPGWRNILSLPLFTSLPITLFKLIAGRINILSKYVYGLYAFVVISYFFTCSLLSIRTKLYIWVLLPILLMIIVSIAFPQTQPFRLIYTLPWIILIISQTAHKSPKTIISIAIYIFLFGLILYTTRPRLQREEWRQVGEYLEKNNAVVVYKFPEPFAPLQWYQPNLQYVSSVKSFPAKYDEVEKKLNSSNLPNNIYLLEYLTDLTDPQRNTETYLRNNNYIQKEVVDFIGVGFVTKYTK